MEKGAFFSADVDERGLDPRQNRFDFAEVYVTHRAEGVGTVHQQLNKAVVLQDGHTGFPRAPADENLSLQSLIPRPQPASSRSGSHYGASKNSVRLVVQKTG